MMTFDEFFKTATKSSSRAGNDPHVWQTNLAGSAECTNRLIRIPTGMGKTLGVLSAWAYHRVQCKNTNWPTRLVWCLPMRTLVEQTHAEAERILQNAVGSEVSAQILMGGVEQTDWHIHPDRPAVLVGTQDMLLSRALNRGYACGRARWPVEYGLLNHDALWVMDEVQLMDVGLATSAQLQAFRDADRSKSLRPCYTWWMSATLQPEWLKSVDTSLFHHGWTSNVCSIAPNLRTGGLWDIHKSCVTESIDAKKAHDFAKRILEAHQNSASGEYGKITLVVCNTVDRAFDTYSELRKAGRTENIELVHSRFRPSERESWRDRFLTRQSCSTEVDRIIVATQVVEAGVDISATCLITDLAPWPSLVQRFGRCARYGGSGQVLVIDRGHDEKTSAPYSSEELESAWNSIQSLSDVGIKSIEEFEQSLTTEARVALYPYAPQHLLLRNEFDELFDTTPDLTGADLDISRFIRTGDERDVQVFWRSLPTDQGPEPDVEPHRRELCSVPFLKARDWLCGAETKTNRKPKLRAGMRAWIWDWIDGKWVEARRESLIPGKVICVDAGCGGYVIESGFAPDSKNAVPEVAPVELMTENVSSRPDNSEDNEGLSVNEWKTIACHSNEVSAEVTTICDSVGLPSELRSILELVAVWHDIGKGHPAFQGAIRDSKSDVRPMRQDLAKGPKSAWLKPVGTYKFAETGENRPGFRHELASALAMFALLENYAPEHPALLGNWREVFTAMNCEKDLQATTDAVPAVVKSVLECTEESFDLLVYLIASHHGKVRATIQASPKDQEYRDNDGRGFPIRGVREGDLVPSLKIGNSMELIPDLLLTLSPAALGLSTRTGASWRERCLGLLDRHGPTALAYLEAVFRAADVRASKLKTEDSAMLKEVNV